MLRADLIMIQLSSRGIGKIKDTLGSRRERKLPDLYALTDQRFLDLGHNRIWRNAHALQSPAGNRFTIPQEAEKDVLGIDKAPFPLLGLFLSIEDCISCFL